MSGTGMSMGALVLTLAALGAMRFAPERPRPPPPNPWFPKLASPALGTGEPFDTLNLGIRRISEREVWISRATWLHLPRQERSVTFRTRVVLDETGLCRPRLFGIRRLSLLGRLGFQNGDRIVGIGGTGLCDRRFVERLNDQILSLPRFDVVVIRQGQMIALRYAVK